MTEFFDPPRPATAFDHDSTLVVAMELSGKFRQLGAVVPGVSRRPERGLKAGDTAELLAITQLRYRHDGLHRIAEAPGVLCSRASPVPARARVNATRKNIMRPSIKRALTGLLIAGALAFSAVGADAMGGTIPTAVMRSSASLAADAPARPKGAADTMHAPSTTQTVTLTGTARAAIERKWRIRRRSQPLRPRPNIRVTRGKVAVKRSGLPWRGDV